MNKLARDLLCTFPRLGIKTKKTKSLATTAYPRKLSWHARTDFNEGSGRDFWPKPIATPALRLIAPGSGTH